MTNYNSMLYVDCPVYANPRLSTASILNAVKGGEAIRDKPQPISTDNGPGVRDRKYPVSSYGDDYESCLESLQKVGVSSSQAIETCQSRWKGKGTRTGTRSASVEIPAWAAVSVDEALLNRPRNKSIYDNNLKSASLDEVKQYHEAITEGTIASLQKKADNRIRNAKLKKKVDDDRPAWLIATSNG
jgi:hypothetical protein